MTTTTPTIDIASEKQTDFQEYVKSEYTIKVYNSITEIDESEWDEIAGRNRIICTHRYLEAVEKSNINDCNYFYPVVYANDKIIAHACAYSISMELDIFAKGIIKKIINLIRKVWKNFLIIKTVECGTPTALGNTISFRENTNNIKALNLICQTIEEIAKKRQIKIIFIRDFYEADRSLFDNLLNLGYGRSYNLPCAILDIHWNSFSEYLNNLRSDYRRKIIAKEKKFNNSGVQVKLLDNYLPYVNSFTELWRNLYDNAKEYRREILTPNFFENIDLYLKNQTEAIIFLKNNSIIAFILLIYNNEILIPLYAGLDYEMNKEYKLYFNLFYKIIENAIRKKVKHIEFGITTLEPKKQIGCEIVNLYIYIKHLNSILNILINKTFNMFIPKTKLLCNNALKYEKKNL